MPPPQRDLHTVYRADFSPSMAPDELRSYMERSVSELNGRFTFDGKHATSTPVTTTLVVTIATELHQMIEEERKRYDAWEAGECAAYDPTTTVQDYIYASNSCAMLLLRSLMVPVAPEAQTLSRELVTLGLVVCTHMHPFLHHHEAFHRVVALFARGVYA